MTSEAGSSPEMSGPGLHNFLSMPPLILFSLSLPWKDSALVYNSQALLKAGNLIPGFATRNLSLPKKQWPLFHPVSNFTGVPVAVVCLNFSKELYLFVLN